MQMTDITESNAMAHLFVDGLTIPVALKGAACLPADRVDDITTCTTGAAHPAVHCLSSSTSSSTLSVKQHIQQYTVCQAAHPAVHCLSSSTSSSTLSVKQHIQQYTVCQAAHPAVHCLSSSSPKCFCHVMTNYCHALHNKNKKHLQTQLNNVPV